jgi:protein ImuB
VSRYACLLIPDLPLAAALRTEPELAGRPLAVVDDQSIISGWLRGLTLTQARAVAPDLVVRPVSLPSLASAQDALVDVALSTTPRVEDARRGVAYLDLAGSDALFPSERGLLTALDKRLGDVGLGSVHMGIGPTRTIARLAARHDGGGHIVRAAEAPAFLAPLPLDLLEPTDELWERLTRWGLRTLGDLARIPRPALGTRLGEEGVRLARRARGDDLAPFRPTPPRLRFEESEDPGYPVHNLEALAFALRGVLDRLTRRLRLRGLAVRELLLELTLESGALFTRSVSVGAPTVEAGVLLSLLRLALERNPPPEAIELLRVTATPGSVEVAQLDLFLPPLPAPAELAVTVARLEALCGPDRVGAPGIEDSHRPDAARLETFAIDLRQALARERAVAPEADRAPRQAMALRALRPPRTARVRQRDERPASVELDGQGLRVLRCAGPWRLFGEWWGDSRFARDYFDVELSDGGVYRIYHNLQDGSWYVDGLYD